MERMTKKDFEESKKFIEGSDHIISVEKKPLKRQCMNAWGKPKKTFITFEDAVEWAKKMNKNPKFIHKQVAYKCWSCFKFHTGRSQHNTKLEHKVNLYKNET